VLEVLIAAGVVTGAGLFWRRSRKRPGVPLSWQTSQSVAAELHRRMHRSVDRTRRTVGDVRKRGVPTETYEGLLDQLSATTRAVDDQLVVASRLPFKARHKTLLGLRYRIGEVERICGRVETAALEAASPLIGSVDDSLQAVNERLDSIDEARQELREISGEL
jgi:hypothetical protein